MGPPWHGRGPAIRVGCAAPSISSSRSWRTSEAPRSNRLGRTTVHVGAPRAPVRVLNQLLYAEASPAPTKVTLSLLGRCSAEVRLPLVAATPGLVE